MVVTIWRWSTTHASSASSDGAVARACLGIWPATCSERVLKGGRCLIRQLRQLEHSTLQSVVFQLQLAIPLLKRLVGPFPMRVAVVTGELRRRLKPRAAMARRCR